MSSAQQPTPTKIDLSKPRYDQSSYTGRIQHFLDVIDPFTLFTSDTQLKHALTLIDKYKNNDPQALKTPVDELYAAKKLKDSMIHPDTGDVVPMIGRMSGRNSPECIRKQLLHSYILLTNIMIYLSYCTFSQHLSLLI